MATEPGGEQPPPSEVPEQDEGPYGLRGEHTPPFASMLGGYGIIFAGVILLPLILFILIRFIIL